MRAACSVPVLLVIAASLVAGCGEAPTAPLASSGELAPRLSASTFTSSSVAPVAVVDFVPCANDGAGESVLVTGRLHVLTHVTEDGAGGLSTVVHFQPMGVAGEGLTTGDAYQGIGVTRTVTREAATYPVVVTVINRFGLVGAGSGNNLLVKETVHVTINANGETTVDTFKGSVECR